jgi:peptidoglycan DL-endopeptidase CwlO
MTMADVALRIAQLQQLVAPPSPRPASAVSSTRFADVLASAQSVDDPAAGAGTVAGDTSGLTGADAVDAASAYLGVPYRWGGADPQSGLDCSGLVQRAYKDLGIDLPRVAADQARMGAPVDSLAVAKPGDLVAFGTPVDHIGIYVGDGKMVVAPHRGEVVKIQTITATPTAIRRIIPDDPAASTPPSTAYDAVFRTAEARNGLPPGLLGAVAKVESGLNPDAVSGAGAEGLMQLMPGTAAGLGVDPFDPAQAIDGAARLPAGHLQRFGSIDLALAAYNAGSGAVQRAGGIPNIPETQAYVRKVMGLMGGGQ